MALTRTSRRTFLKGLGGGALVLVAASSQVSTAWAAEAGDASQACGILIDLTRCTGCESCVLACKQANRRPRPETPPDRLSSGAYSYLDVKLVTTQDGTVTQQAVKRQCMNCLHPACVAACTVGALRKQPNGPVTYESAKCIGCRYCQYACPFGVPTYEWDNPLGLIHKCQFCQERTANGDSPACVAACPNGALRFGRRSALLAQAHAQIQTNSGRYVDHVYGEHEAGGTSMLYLSSVPFAQLGFPTLDAKPISADAETIMERTPWVALTMAALATSLHLITRRHRELAAEMAPAATSPVAHDQDAGA